MAVFFNDGMQDKLFQGGQSPNPAQFYPQAFVVNWLK